MTDILIRGLSEAAVSRIDAEAESQGLSRNELLRRRLEGEVSSANVVITADDWSRSASVFGDLDDPSVMAAAWR